MLRIERAFDVKHIINKDGTGCATIDTFSIAHETFECGKSRSIGDVIKAGHKPEYSIRTKDRVTWAEVEEDINKAVEILNNKPSNYTTVSAQ